ncbi:hypothetical protein KFE98_07595 [bacterium SCSIO 12741]|nr:hypothetical protein KFE98_07595 [bacterium SCSIO 12741]
MKKQIIAVGLTLGLMAGYQNLSAQKFDTETVEFEYIKLPLEPLPAEVKTYGCDVELTYKESTEAEKQARQEEREREIEAIENRSQAEKIITAINRSQPKARKQTTPIILVTTPRRKLAQR